MVKNIKTDFDFTCQKPADWVAQPDFIFVDNYVENSWNCYEDFEAAKRGLGVLLDRN